MAPSFYPRLNSDVKHAASRHNNTGVACGAKDTGAIDATVFIDDVTCVECLRAIIRKYREKIGQLNEDLRGM